MEPIITPSFNDFKLNKQLLTAVADAGFTIPTPVQQQTIPLLLAGHDVLGIAQTGTGIAELRDAFLSDRSRPMQQILDRAVERGEVDPTKLTPRVTEVAFDLYRQEMLMTLKAVPDEVAESIVDEVFLPLVIKR